MRTPSTYPTGRSAPKPLTCKTFAPSRHGSFGFCLERSLGGLDIAVDDAALVHGRQGGGDLLQDREHPGQLAVAAAELAQRRTSDELHDQEQGAAGRHIDIDDLDEVRMNHLGQQLRLAGKAHQRRPVLLGAQDLGGEPLVVGSPLDFVDRAHRALTEGADDPIDLAEQALGGQLQRRPGVGAGLAQDRVQEVPRALINLAQQLFV